MSNKRIEKKHSKLAQITAKKSRVAERSSIRPLVNPQKERGSGPDAIDGFRHLHPRCPDPEEEPGPLPKSQAHRLTTAVLAELKVLRPNLNLSYWKKFTYEFLRSDASQVLVNPARAGSGKPTALARVMHFLEEWDGAPLRVAEVRERLQISPSAWKELMKQPQLRRELDKCGVLRTGGGRHATWSRPGGDVLPA